jgi:hypothetical protein
MLLAYQLRCDIERTEWEWKEAKETQKSIATAYHSAQQQVQMTRQLLTQLHKILGVDTKARDADVQVSTGRRPGNTILLILLFYRRPLPIACSCGVLWTLG